MSAKFVASLFAITSLGGAPAVFAANDGIIDFTGRITTTTCSVEGKNPGEGSVRKTVDLGAISAGGLTAAGQTAGDRGFSIVIGGNDECTDDAVAKVRFDPASPALDVASGRLNIDKAVGAAENVQIELTQPDGTPINLFTQDSQGVKIVEHKATIPLVARYYSLGSAKAGGAASRVGFQVVYE